MSSEPAKSEVDCAVAPYSHHHHHHHHHHHPHLAPHQNPLLQHHHNPRRDHLYHLSPMPTACASPDPTNLHHRLDDIVSGLNVTQSDANDQSGKPQVIDNDDQDDDEGDHGVSGEEEDDEDADEGEDEDEDDEEDQYDEDEDDDDDNDDDDEADDDDDDDDDDDVDPVGPQPNNAHLQQRLTIDANEYDCNGTNLNCYDRINNNHELTGDENVSFENDSDESEHQNDFSATGLLDSERMLEVTRKLVRSTERDPDRDLRKQVLLKTAIRKLPHFIEYNHYSESFDQSFQMHNNTLESNNTSITCMSPAQYYEHNHLSHHQMDAQQKSYYLPVQPNAIQMSTTSLRMLDLNDDTESEQAITSLEPEHHHPQHHQHHHHHHHHHHHLHHQEHIYEEHSSHGVDVDPTCNEQQQQEYASHQLDIIKSIPSHLDSSVSSLVETLEAEKEDEEEQEEVESDQSGCSEGGSSNSSQSSTASDDSINSSSSSRTNDSAGGDFVGIPILETSLNTSEDHRFDHLHDSGVELFSPKSNKRSSSSISLDDEMEIDHLTDLTSSNQFNSGGTLSNLNQCKRMRKREIMD